MISVKAYQGPYSIMVVVKILVSENVERSMVFDGVRSNIATVVVKKLYYLWLF